MAGPKSRHAYRQTGRTGFGTVLLRQKIRSLEAEVERLETTIAKIPKTKDGVPLYPGMKVWWRLYHHSPWIERTIRCVKLLPWDDDDERVHVEFTEAYRSVIGALCSEVYSTLEAAKRMT